jgi:hypothetical protein
LALSQLAQHLPAFVVPVEQKLRPGAEHVPTHMPLVHVTVAPVPGVGQTTQVTPLLPQALVVLPAWQELFSSQQPFGQLVDVHLHSPFTHSVPCPHETHVPPLEPQAPSVVPGWQVLFPQQPLQLSGKHSHEPFLHVVPDGHERQTTPLEPQALVVLPGWQELFSSQQPFRQLVDVHLHSPSTHVVPCGHETHISP